MADVNVQGSGVHIAQESPLSMWTSLSVLFATFFWQFHLSGLKMTSQQHCLGSLSSSSSEAVAHLNVWLNKASAQMHLAESQITTKPVAFWGHPTSCLRLRLENNMCTIWSPDMAIVVEASDVLYMVSCSSGRSAQHAMHAKETPKPFTLQSCRPS